MMRPKPLRAVRLKAVLALAASAVLVAAFAVSFLKLGGVGWVGAPAPAPGPHAVRAATWSPCTASASEGDPNAA